MLFASPNPLLQIVGIKQAKDNYNEHTGQYVDTTPGIDAQFRNGGAPDWAYDIAEANPRFQRVWESLPEEQLRRAYIGTYDSVKEQQMYGWDDETREAVEATLLRHPGLGQLFILVETPEEIRNLPWPSYDTTHHQQVVKIAKEIGVPLEQVLEWEQSHRARPFVIESLEKELDAVDDFVAA